MGKSTISMAIFNSYVCLPEGKWDSDDSDGFSDGIYWYTAMVFPWSIEREMGMGQSYSGTTQIEMSIFGINNPFLGVPNIDPYGKII